MSSFVTKGGVGPALSVAPFFSYMMGSKGASGFGPSTTAEEVAASWDGRGKTVIITGSASGLGFESARVLADRGAEVIITARDLGRATDAMERLKKEVKEVDNAKLVPMALDLGSFVSIKDFVSRFLASGKPLNMLMNNAGIMGCPWRPTADGHEPQLGTNHYGHYLLSVLLVPKMIETAKSSGTTGRIITTSSVAHHWGYKGGILPEDKLDDPKAYNKWSAYGQSKLANLLFSRSLNEKLKAKGADVIAVSLHPGVIDTNLGRHVSISSPVKAISKVILSTFLKTMSQGAATQVYCATAAEVTGGEFYQNCNLFPSSAVSHDKALADRLWAISAKVTGADL